ncbi:MAG TPA: exodeoxyribonuclease III [Longimicrobiaceae bacterium]|nr:exodeoxyribonuclease III [Longimicrobiaceae bacterium]
MKIATWNVNGIRAREVQLLDWITEERPDVVALQEIKAPLDKVPESLCPHPDYWCTWHGTKAYSGVSLMVRRDFAEEEPGFVHPPFDFEERIVVTRLGDVTAASIYVPNGGKDFRAKVDFFQNLVAYAEELRAAGRELLLLGDFNVTREERDVHPKERKPTAIGQRPEEREMLAELLDVGLVDLGRLHAPDDDRLFTWWAPWRNLRQRNIGWRIDYLLATPALADASTSCRSLREVGTSDHAPVVAELETG